VLAVRMKPHRAELTADGPNAPVGTGPQAIFLGALIAFVAYVAWEMSRLTFLARVFPLSVALIALALLGAVAVAYLRKNRRPSYLFYDSERGWGGERPVHGDLHFQSWMLGMLAAIGLVGFLPGIFAFIVAFLRLKAGVRWHNAALGAAGAVGLFVLLSYLLVLDYPRGLLQRLVELPWPIG
jgi:hypothetical protein